MKVWAPIRAVQPFFGKRLCLRVKKFCLQKTNCISKSENDPVYLFQLHLVCLCLMENGQVTFLRYCHGLNIPLPILLLLGIILGKGGVDFPVGMLLFSGCLLHFKLKIKETRPLSLIGTTLGIILQRTFFHIFNFSVFNIQKLDCLHYLYVAYMAHGPLTEGLKYAEEEYHLSKSAELDSSTHKTLSEIQHLQFQAACNIGNAHCFLGNLDKAKIFLDKGKEIASKLADPDKIALATIHHGNWLLASGQLKIAINEVYRPLMRETLSDYNRGLMLRGFGNACRLA